jgi:hypothetical protein
VRTSKSTPVLSIRQSRGPEGRWLNRAQPGRAGITREDDERRRRGTLPPAGSKACAISTVARVGVRTSKSTPVLSIRQSRGPEGRWLNRAQPGRAGISREDDERRRRGTLPRYYPNLISHARSRHNLVQLIQRKRTGAPKTSELTVKETLPFLPQAIERIKSYLVDEGQT